MFNSDGGLVLPKATQDVHKRDSRQYKILIVDDEQSVHDVTLLALEDIVFNNKTLEIFHAYSASEAKELLQREKDIAVIFLDVVMETDSAGLDLVKIIREELQNKAVRIILRTGQPGHAPEDRIIIDYDINDYKSKAELTTQKLFTSLISALRTYSHLVQIEKNQNGLEKVLSSTYSIVKIKQIDDFISGLMEQVVSLIHENPTSHENEINAYIGFCKNENVIFTSGTGKYQDKDSRHILVQNMYADKISKIRKNEKIMIDEESILVYKKNDDDTALLLLLDGDIERIDTDSSLLDIFMRNAAITYHNILLTKNAKDTQKDTIFLLSEMAEQRSQETGKHVKRVAYYAKEIAEELNLSKKEIEEIVASAPMHDIGKIAISDRVLKKPGRLTDEEFEEMKTHATKGYELLKDSDKDIMLKAAIIAHEHHEKHDGTGYPRGLKGDEIHIFASIVGLCDVFDALSNPRVYKEAWSLEETFEYIESERGKQFNPKVLDAFFSRKENIIKIHTEQKD
ncbi:DUF3369 domain-containing protein [Sulfurimonas sp.]|nr:DUF3369 domain-containing protein [Sulfurimonas sp.]